MRKLILLFLMMTIGVSAYATTWMVYNGDTVPHTVTIVTEGGTKKQQTINPSQTVAFQFDAGAYVGTVQLDTSLAATGEQIGCSYPFDICGDYFSICKIGGKVGINATSSPGCS